MCIFVNLALLERKINFLFVAVITVIIKFPGRMKRNNEAVEKRLESDTDLMKIII